MGQLVAEQERLNEDSRKLVRQYVVRDLDDAGRLAFQNQAERQQEIAERLRTLEQQLLESDSLAANIIRESRPASELADAAE